MITYIHEYNYDIRKPEDAKAYTQLCERMKQASVKCFESWGGNSHYQPSLDGQELTLETEHLFSDQWNTAPLPGHKLGLRVFDWAQDYFEHTKWCKRGHWLELPAEAIKLRHETLICGYCGKNYPPGTAQGRTFCDACLDSSYLKETDLPLLRLMPVALRFPKRGELTADEKAQLLQAYVERQTIGKDSRAVRAKQQARSNVEERYRKVTDAAKTEHDGLIWLLDHNVSIDNVIYYSYTGRFCFGWRTDGLSESVKSKLLDVLCEFPFDYDIKDTAKAASK